MAKKTKVTETPDGADAGEDVSTALVALEASYEVVADAVVKLDAAIEEAAVKYAQENDEYNVWAPEKEQEALGATAVVARIVRFLSAKPVEQGKGNATYTTILATLYDYKTGGRLRVWLGQHVLLKIAEAKLHETGYPFCLTYRGKVMSKNYGKEATAWNLYVYTADERKKLFGSTLSN